jgi:hypothetical protein
VLGVDAGVVLPEVTDADHTDADTPLLLVGGQGFLVA